jgi:predicted membrane protein
MSISGLTATVGTASAPQTFTVSGVNLTSGVTVTAPAGFEVSNGGANYAGLLTLSPIDGTLENTTVSVRISDSANSGGINGTILIQSDAVEESVSVLGVVGSSAAFVVGSNFSTFTTTLGTPSAVQTFTVSGANLSGDVTVAAPSGFEVSIDGSSFSSSLALMPSNGAVSASISVRIAAATPVGSPSGNITVSSSGAQDIAVAMSGKVDPVPPALSTSGTLTSFTTTEGTASSVQAFTVSGSNLTGNVTVAAPSGFEVSIDGSSFSTSLALTPSSGTVSASISVRVASAAPSGSLSGNVSVSAEGAASKTVSVNATVTAMPRINVVGSLIPFDAISGTASAEQTLQLSGSNLTGNVTITVPTRFEVSSGSGQPFASSLTINPISGSIVNQSIFVRLAAAPVGNYSGDVGFSTSSASAINVAVSGTVVPPPTIDGVAKFVNFSSTQGSASASQ